MKTKNSNLKLNRIFLLHHTPCILCFFLTFHFQLFTFSSFAQFTFVHITDLHIADGTSAGSYDLNGVAFQQTLNAINDLSPKPAFVVATGDISHAGNYAPYGMYPALTQHLFPGLIMNPAIGTYFIDSAQTIPIYFVPGNHDYRTGNMPPLSSSALTDYSEYISPDTDYAITVNNAVILFLRSGYDALRPLWEDSNYMSPEGSGLTNAQCSWIRNILNANSNKKKVIVMHHPPVNVAGTYPDGSPFTGTIVDPADGSIINNRITFLNICDSNHVDIVLAGHVHQNVVASRGGSVVNENWCDSTRYIQTGASFQGCYRIITVDTSCITVSPPLVVQPTGIDNQQLSNESEALIYPNPANDRIHIDITDRQHFKMQINNMIGECILQRELNNTNDIDVSSLSKGIYIIQLTGADKIIQRKLIKN